MLEEIKEKIQKLSGDDDYLTRNQYPNHEYAFRDILEQVGAEDIGFELLEQEIKIDSDGYPYINFDAVLEKEEEKLTIEMTAYHDGEWYYYNRLKN